MAKIHWHAMTMELAESLVEKACEIDEGKKCFNLALFLELLETDLDARYGDDKPCGRFKLDFSNVAHYLWCCLALANGDDPGGYKFRGMPILY